MKTLNNIAKIFLLTSCLLPTNCSYVRQKDILYVNSYHEGYPSSDQIMKGIKQTLEGKNIDLEIFFLNSKLDNDSLHIKILASKIYQYALEIDPDLIILSDDNAVKYFGETFGNRLGKPLVFCGVNWDYSDYNLPDGLFTGMLEVLPVKECIDLIMKDKPGIKRLGILSENTLSEQKNNRILDTLTGLENDYAFVNTFEEWKYNFIRMNDSADLIFLPTNGAIKNWNKEEAANLVKNHAKVPVFTCDEFMMEYSMVGMTKLAEEQGIWAAQTALRILNGEEIQNIPVEKNKEFLYWYNPELADKIGYKPSVNIEFRQYPP